MRGNEERRTENRKGKLKVKATQKHKIQENPPVYTRWVPDLVLFLGTLSETAECNDHVRSGKLT